MHLLSSSFGFQFFLRTCYVYRESAAVADPFSLQKIAPRRRNEHQGPVRSPEGNRSEPERSTLPPRTADTTAGWFGNGHPYS